MEPFHAKVAECDKRQKAVFLSTGSIKAYSRVLSVITQPTLCGQWISRLDALPELQSEEEEDKNGYS